MKALRLLAMLMLLSALATAAVWLAQLEGTCIDEAGKPLANAELKFLDKKTGRRFSVKTNAQGKFSYNAVEPGSYAVTVRRAGSTAIDFPAIAIAWSTKPQSFSLDLRTHAVAVKRETLTTESFAGDGSYEEPAVAMVGDDPKTAELREKLAAAQADEAAGQWERAIVTLKNLTAGVGAREAVSWSQLANAYCRSGNYPACVDAYTRAIEFKEVGAYYNNRAQAWIKLERWHEADADLTMAVKANPEHRALYEQNRGVMLVQKVQDGNSDDSAQDFAAAANAFKKVLAEDPQRAELYYLRAYCQIRLLGLTKEPPPYADIESDLRKYLDLEPQGKHTDEVKEMLASIEKDVPPEK